LHERSEPGGVRIVDHGPRTRGESYALHPDQVRVDADECHRVVREMRKAGPGAAVHCIGVSQHRRFGDSEMQGCVIATKLSRELISLPLRPQRSADPQSGWVRQPD
jgi:dTDP-4-amino-4,6-dideoxygalactose transaminase